MNWLDVGLLLILAVSVLTSFRKGLSRELIGLASVFLALILGIRLYARAGTYLAPYVSTHTAANLGGFFIVFCGVLLLGGVVSFVVGKFLKVTGLSILDHLLGAGFGMVRGVLVAVALVMGLMAFTQNDHAPQAVVESRLAPYVVDGARVFVTVAPHELKDGFTKTYVQVKAAWGKAFEKVPNAEKSKNERKI